MAKTIIRRSLVKVSAAKPSGKTPPKDKTLELEPAIRFYETEDSDKTEEGEKHKILIIND